MNQRSVLITGCSSGIGWAVAEEMAARNWRIFATARKPEDWQRIEAEGWNAVALDVTSSASIEQAVATVLDATDGALDGVVNNAGFGMPGAIEDLSREAMQLQFEVNLFGAVELTNRLLPSLRKRPQGRVVYISSLVGRMSLPFMGIYSASKFALEAVADAQRIELSMTPVRVVLIEPGPIETRFSATCARVGESELEADGSRFRSAYERYFKQRRDGGMSEDRFRLPPEAVAKKVAHALISDRPKVRYPVTLPTYVADFLVRFVPVSWRDAVMQRQVKKRFGSD
ncbi:MAG: short-chain dehydrogenase [Kiritimatiellaceae bacterium]|nr:short-chain dehydrogenase [Kiritimatiellaceae bacterium]